MNSPTWPYVLAFAKRMEAKLAANRHKGDRDGWLNDDPRALWNRIADELNELRVEMGDRNFPVSPDGAERIANEAADVANFAMMVADWYIARATGTLV